MSDDEENPNSILVVGKAGIGKSLFCQKIVRDWAKNELFKERENTKVLSLNCVYLLSFRQLNLFQNNYVTLREILTFSSLLDDNSNTDDFTFEYIVKHPKEVMIILDGYDEYSQQDYIAGNLEEHPNDARRKMPVAALCSKLIEGKILKGAYVSITSRPDKSDKLGGIRFKRYVEIAGFSPEQVKEYIEKYLNKNEEIKNAVLEHVMNNANLVSFAHIPMPCYLLCFEMEYTLSESGNPHDLPVSTTDLYTTVYFCHILHRLSTSSS
ncbi:NACHT, LRR and PYD domains-containing protein 12-like [Stylophora pistillata]|uniref:NACHT, LRR and PYD domains-containing protein 12-like n=1 Tax=Stylophora pistillata TaxID=50429 RepID=UPI000C03CF28|nr:NACHT, LRR and PYD domains-containing protein 12-like [Stylophora pistillata]